MAKMSDELRSRLLPPTTELPMSGVLVTEAKLDAIAEEKACCRDPSSDLASKYSLSSSCNGSGEWTRSSVGKAS